MDDKRKNEAIYVEDIVQLSQSFLSNKFKHAMEVQATVEMKNK